MSNDKIDSIVKGACIRRKSDGRKMVVDDVTNDIIVATYHGPVFDDVYDIPVACFADDFDLVIESVADLALAAVDMFDKANGMLDLGRDGSGGHVIEAVGYYPSELAKVIDRLRAALVREGTKPIRVDPQGRGAVSHPSDDTTPEAIALHIVGALGGGDDDRLVELRRDIAEGIRKDRWARKGSR
jgi:hypothetical protein